MLPQVADRGYRMDIAAAFMAAIINAFEANKRLADRAVEQVPESERAGAGHHVTVCIWYLPDESSPSRRRSMTFGSLPERIFGDRRDRHYRPRFAASTE